METGGRNSVNSHAKANHTCLSSAELNPRSHPDPTTVPVVQLESAPSTACRSSDSERGLLRSSTDSSEHPCSTALPLSHPPAPSQGTSESTAQVVTTSESTDPQPVQPKLVGSPSTCKDFRPTKPSDSIAVDIQVEVPKPASGPIPLNESREYWWVLLGGVCLAFNAGYVNGICLSGVMADGD